MNRQLSIIAMLLSIVSLTAFAPAKESSFPAITPEVQTAEWAVTWWMPRHEAKLKAKREAGKVDLLFVGDSITQGWEQDGKEVWNEFYAKRNTFNLGFSGDRTEQVLWRIEHEEFDDLQPKAIVLLIGTNNTGHRQDPAEQTAEGIRQVVTKLHEKMPAAHVLLLAIFPRGQSADDPLRQLNNKINAAVKPIGEQDYVTYLDIGGKFLQDDGTLSAEVMPDYLHLSPSSYKIWAEAIEPELAKHF